MADGAEKYFNGHCLMSEFFLEIAVPGRISSRRAGECFLNLVVRHFSDAVPERLGNTEPLTKKFDAKNIGGALDLWGTGPNFIAGRRDRKLYLMVSFWPVASNRPRHSSITFFNVAADPNSVYDFLIDASEAFDADYGFAHPLTQVEVNERIDNVRERMLTKPSFRVQFSEQVKSQIKKHGYIGMTQPQLFASIESATMVPGGPELADREFRRLTGRVEKEGFARVLSTMIIEGIHIDKYLPGLFWVNVFGRPYLEIFGRERLLSSPAAQIREGTNRIALTTTSLLEDTAASWSEFKAIRNRCTNHLNSDAFFDSALGAGHPYRTPEFVFHP
jgi:hypothetical protein